MDKDHEALSSRLENIEHRLQKIERYMLWGTIFGTLRFLLIAIPIALAIVYIPPFLQSVMPEFSQYLDLLRKATRVGR